MIQNRIMIEAEQAAKVNGFCAHSNIELTGSALINSHNPRVQQRDRHGRVIEQMLEVLQIKGRPT